MGLFVMSLEFEIIGFGIPYAQNDNSNAVSAKELHNFPYLCRKPLPLKTQRTKTLKHI
jgi:hypothetical protein